VGGETVPQRIIQRVVTAQNDQVFIFLLKADRMGRNNCHQFAEMHGITCCKDKKKGARSSESVLTARSPEKLKHRRGAV
jgi:hypothetical protein